MLLLVIDWNGKSQLGLWSRIYCTIALEIQLLPFASGKPSLQATRKSRNESTV